MLQYTAQFLKNDVGRVSLNEYSPPRLSRINAWSEANLLSLYLGNIQCWYFFKIRYEITILIITCRYKIFRYENIMSLSVIHSQVWYASRDLHPRNITMLGNNTSPDVNTSPNQCLESIAISFAHANWSSMGTRSSNDSQKPDHMTGTRIAAPDKKPLQHIEAFHWNSLANAKPVLLNILICRIISISLIISFCKRMNSYCNWNWYFLNMPSKNTDECYHTTLPNVSDLNMFQYHHRQILSYILHEMTTSK